MMRKKTRTELYFDRVARVSPEMRILLVECGKYDGCRYHYVVTVTGDIFRRLHNNESGDYVYCGTIEQVKKMGV